MISTVRQERSTHSLASRLLRRAAISAVAAGAFLLAPGCDNAGSGAVAGGLLGALGGLAIGSVTGSGGKGAVIGAVAGAAAGGVIGDQNARSSNRNYSYDNHSSSSRSSYESHGHRSSTYESYSHYDSRPVYRDNVDVSVHVYEYSRPAYRSTYVKRYHHGHRHGCGCNICR